jgi:hypothetical protein
MVKDIEKVRAARRRWYVRNKQHAVDKVQTRKKALWTWFNEYKNTLNWVCACGETDVVCMDFHHRDPNSKRTNIGWMVNSGYSKESILAEIEKCDKLCSNCHRKLHRDLKE